MFILSLTVAVVGAAAGTLTAVVCSKTVEQTASYLAYRASCRRKVDLERERANIEAQIYTEKYKAAKQEARKQGDTALQDLVDDLKDL